MRQIRSHTALRGIAALLVMAYHLQFSSSHLWIETATPFFRRCYVWVDLFFILSGFIVSYVNNADGGVMVSRAEYAGFLRGRIARIYPLHVVCLTALVAATAALTIPYILLHRAWPFDWSGASVLRLAVQYLLLNAFLPLPPAWNVPSWSISAEMFAYLLFPLIVTVHARYPRAVRVFLLSGVLLFYFFIARTSGSLDMTVGLGWVRCVCGFALGMLVFYHRTAFQRAPGWLLSALQVISLVTIVVALSSGLSDPWAVPGFALLVGSTWRDGGVLGRIFGAQAIQWLGQISYSIYLVHSGLLWLLGFLLERAHLPAALPATLGRCAWIAFAYGAVLWVSHVTFNFVERPARQWLSRRWLGHAAPPIATAASAP